MGFVHRLSFSLIYIHKRHFDLQKQLFFSEKGKGLFSSEHPIWEQIPTPGGRGGNGGGEGGSGQAMPQTSQTSGQQVSSASQVKSHWPAKSVPPPSSSKARRSNPNPKPQTPTLTPLYSYIRRQERWFRRGFRPGLVLDRRTTEPEQGWRRRRTAQKHRQQRSSLPFRIYH